MGTTNVIETFPAKRLLLPVRHGDDQFFSADYNMNLYRGCNHGCIYCDTRSECYHIDRFDEIRYKQDCLHMLESELRQKRKTGVIFMGSASDSYNAAEPALCLTQRALILLKRYGFGVGITTKSDLSARDGDILTEMSKTAPTYLIFSITAAEDSLSRLLEPGAPVSSRRFAAMQALAKQGVFTGTWICPVVPFVTDHEENILSLIDQTADAGGRFVMCPLGMTLRTGNREYFYEALEGLPAFRGVKQQYVDTFGLQYQCASPRAEALWPILVERCQKKGLLYRFAEISAAIRGQCPSQLRFF